MDRLEAAKDRWDLATVGGLAANGRTSSEPMRAGATIRRGGTMGGSSSLPCMERKQ